MNLADIITKAIGDKLTRLESSELKVRLDLVEGVIRDLDATMGQAGRINQLKFGTVQMSVSEGITITHPSGARAIVLEPWGNAFFGSNVDAPEDTSLAVFSQVEVYNDEPMGAGDVLLGDNSANKANLFWDRSTGQLKLRSGITEGILLDTDGTLVVGASSPTIIIDGVNKNIRSNNWVAGVGGFLVNAVNGDAEFNNITARGSIRASVFTYNEISATAGKILIARDAGELYEDVDFPASPNTVTVKIKIRAGGGQAFYLNEVCRIQAYNGTSVVSVWFQITSLDDSQSTHHEYTVQVRSGGSCTIHKGTAIVNYGATGQGIIELDAVAGNIAPRISILTHTGTPWAAQTQRVVIGQMYGAYGTSTNLRYGIGIGDYSSGNYLSYNAERPNSFILKTGAGKAIIGNLRDTFGTGANDRYGLAVGNYSAGNYLSYNAEAANTFVLKAGGGAIEIGASGIKIEDDQTSVNKVIWQYDQSGNWRRIGFAVGDYTGSGNPAMWFTCQRDTGAPWSEPHAIIQAHDVIDSIDARLDIFTSQTTSPKTGVANFTGIGHVNIMDGGLHVGSGKYDQNDGDISCDGDIFTEEWTNISDTYVVGWASYTNKKIWCKKVGNLVFVNYYISGTSNSTVTYFTLPYTSAEGLGAFTMIRVVEGTWKDGSQSLAASASTVNFYIGIGSAWADGGDKSVIGQFWYEAA